MALLVPLEHHGEALSQVVLAAFIGDRACFALADGRALFMDAGGKAAAVSVHDGLLAAARTHDGQAIVSGGEDGRICRLGADGVVDELHVMKGTWVDRIACGHNGAVAAASGRSGIVIGPDGSVQEFSCERTIEGLALAPKGARLAIARYNGGELRWLSRLDEPQFLEWSGAHTAILFSPDGRHVVTTMQENALHGWRLTDMKHMRMTGYPAKVKSLSFSAKGKWLASSGAPAAITWPFSGKDGPMGKAPREIGSMGGNMVSCVCFHPSEEVLAIGYADGLVLAVSLANEREAVLRQPGGGQITSLAWDEAGRRLAFGTDDGAAGLVDIAAG